jgi:hypothetical protein
LDPFIIYEENKVLCIQGLVFYFFAIQASYKRRLTVLSLSIIDIAVIKAENRV